MGGGGGGSRCFTGGAGSGGDPQASGARGVRRAIRETQPRNAVRIGGQTRRAHHKKPGAHAARSAGHSPEALGHEKGVQWAAHDDHSDEPPGCFAAAMARFGHMRRMRMLVGLCVAYVACGSSSTPEASTGAEDAGGPAGAGHFTYGVGDKVFRIEARVGASPQDVSSALARFGTGTRDRWLVPSVNGAHLVLSTDRLTCSKGECLVIAPSDLSTLSLVTPGIYSSQDGPHDVDLWVTRRAGATWAAAALLTSGSTYAYNNMPALTFDGQRVLFDCGAQSYPESGATTPARCGSTAPASGWWRDRRRCPTRGRTFPHDSVDGVRFQGTWPIGADAPETVWLLPPSGPPTSIGRGFTNAVSPCGLRDGRWGVLWLSRPGNPAGVHELTLVGRDGTVVGALTPNVDVADIGIGCSD